MTQSVDGTIAQPVTRPLNAGTARPSVRMTHQSEGVTHPSAGMAPSLDRTFDLNDAAAVSPPAAAAHRADTDADMATARSRSRHGQGHGMATAQPPPPDDDVGYIDLDDDSNRLPGHHTDCGDRYNDCHPVWTRFSWVASANTAATVP